jgi:hypothetical protein
VSQVRDQVYNQVRGFLNESSKTPSLL